MKLHGHELRDGDVLMTNSPRAGGSYVETFEFICFVYLTKTMRFIC